MRRIYERLLAEGVTSDHIVSVDLDDKAFLELRNPLKLDEYVRAHVRRGKKPYYVFIDEIQRSRKVPAPGVDMATVAPEDRDDAHVTFTTSSTAFGTLRTLMSM